MDALAVPSESAEPEPEIEFEPVPRRRNRKSGWTEERQKAFIAILARCGSVSASARHVGLSPTSVYQLLKMPGAESFATAWDQAPDSGVARLPADALERSLNGAFVPREARAATLLYGGDNVEIVAPRQGG